MNILELIDELIENGMSEEEASEIADFEFNLNHYSDMWEDNNEY